MHSTTKNEASARLIRKTRANVFKSQLILPSLILLLASSSFASWSADSVERKDALKTNRPIFVGRDSVIKYDVTAIEGERRNGYAWYVDSAKDLLSKDYPEWSKKYGG